MKYIIIFAEQNRIKSSKRDILLCLSCIQAFRMGFVSHVSVVKTNHCKESTRKLTSHLYY